MSDDANFKSFVSSLEKQFVPSDEMASDAIEIIRGSLKEYVASRNLRSLVVGLYGDLDSSVVAAICQEKDTGVPLLGIVIPSALNTDITDRGNWAGKKFCTAYHELPSVGYIIAGNNAPAFEKYVDKNVANDQDIRSRLEFTVFQNLAQKTNGIVVGSKTWSDLYATFLHTEGEAGYFPLESVNKGFELPALAKMLNIPSYIINEPEITEELIGATYREVDTIVNGYLGNFDDNLSTQLNRFKALEKFQRVLLRFNLNKYITTLPSREVLGLPTKYNY